MAINSVIWTDKSGDPRLIFHVSNQGQITAELYEANIKNELQDTGIRIDERNITIETENLSALVRGIPQRSFNLSGLSLAQKRAILNSMQSRNIEIMKNHNNQGSMIIHALP